MLIRWVGFGSAQNSWVDEKNVSRKAVAEYDGEYANLTPEICGTTSPGAGEASVSKPNSNAISRLMASNAQIISLHGGKTSKTHRTRAHKAKQRVKARSTGKRVHARRKLALTPTHNDTTDSSDVDSDADSEANHRDTDTGRSPKDNIVVGPQQKPTLPTEDDSGNEASQQDADTGRSPTDNIVVGPKQKPTLPNEDTDSGTKKKKKPLTLEEDKSRLEKARRHACMHAMKINKCIQAFKVARSKSSDPTMTVQANILFSRLTRVGNPLYYKNLLLSLIKITHN